jgi:voltage-gated potassium channel
MRRRSKGSWRPIIQALPMLVTGYLVTILLCAALFAGFEGKPLDVGLWWSFVTAMTIGYGDVFPVTAAGKIVAVALMHVVPLFLVPLITAKMAAKMIVDSDAFTHAEQEEIKQTLARIEARLGDGR